jgi:uncharacterized protein YjiS (DUF1127 family)
MTTIFATETTVSFPVRALQALVRGFRTLQARRARRLVLATMLEMDPGRLDDLGIDVQDIREALATPQPVGARLEARRTARALRWTPDAVSAA